MTGPGLEGGAKPRDDADSSSPRLRDEAVGKPENPSEHRKSGDSPDLIVVDRTKTDISVEEAARQAIIRAEHGKMPARIIWEPGVETVVHPQGKEDLERRVQTVLESRQEALRERDIRSTEDLKHIELTKQIKELQRQMQAIELQRAMRTEQILKERGPIVVSVTDALSTKAAQAKAALAQEMLNNADRYGIPLWDSMPVSRTGWPIPGEKGEVALRTVLGEMVRTLDPKLYPNLTGKERADMEYRRDAARYLADHARGIPAQFLANVVDPSGQKYSQMQAEYNARPLAERMYLETVGELRRGAINEHVRLKDSHPEAFERLGKTASKLDSAVTEALQKAQSDYGHTEGFSPQYLENARAILEAQQARKNAIDSIRESLTGERAAGVTLAEVLSGLTEPYKGGQSEGSELARQLNTNAGQDEPKAEAAQAKIEITDRGIQIGEHAGAVHPLLAKVVEQHRRELEKLQTIDELEKSRLTDRELERLEAQVKRESALLEALAEGSTAEGRAEAIRGLSELVQAEGARTTESLHGVAEHGRTVSAGAERVRGILTPITTLLRELVRSQIH